MPPKVWLLSSRNRRLARLSAVTERRQLFGDRFADGKIEGRVRLKCAGTIAGAVRESGAVVHIAARIGAPRQIEIESGVKRVPLIVVQQESSRWREARNRSGRR